MKIIIEKLRFFFRFLIAFEKKHRRLIVIGFLVGLLSSQLLSQLTVFSFNKNVKKIGLVGKFTPTTLPLEIKNLLSFGLTELLPDGSARPKLATSWEVKNGGSQYLFTLKKGVHWHDQTEVVAQDINYHFSDVASVAVDKNKIQFKLKEPFSPFPVVVARPLFKKKLIGVGGYRLKSIKFSGQTVQKLTLEPAFDPSLPKIVYKFYPSEEAAIIAFKLGEVDTLKNLSSPRNLTHWPRIKIKKEEKFDQYIAVFLNTQNEKLSSKSVRQALAYAIEKRWQPRALSSFNPSSWAYNPAVKPYNFDLEKARKLLKKEENVSIEKIKLSTIPSLLEVAEEIKNDWEKLGIKTEIKIINSLDEKFEALLIAQKIPPDPDQYLFWHSTQKTNLSGYKSPRLDKLLEEGRKTLNQEKRKEIYHDFQRFLVEEVPAIFLFHPTLYTISRE